MQGTVGVVVGVAGAVTGGLGFTSSSSSSSSRFGGGGLKGRESQLREGGRETGRGSVFGRLWS